jgi:pyruvate-formate lyase-activating enzyme
MKCDRNMKTFIAIIGILACILIPSLLRAEDVCVSEESAKRVVVDIEKGKVNEEQIVTLKAYNLELEKQVSLMKEVVKLKDDQIKKNEEMIEQQKKLMEYQAQACEERVKNAKPGIFDGLIKIIGGVGIGVIVAVLLL